MVDIRRATDRPLFPSMTEIADSAFIQGMDFVTSNYRSVEESTVIEESDDTIMGYYVQDVQKL